MNQQIRKYLQSNILKNSAWLFILQIFNTVIPLLTLPYITRILGPSGYGSFSMALNWVCYIQVIVEYGFGLSASRKVAMLEEKSEISKIFSNIIMARVFLMAISFVILLCVGAFLHVSKGDLVCMLILYLMVFGTAFQQTWLFQGMQEMKNITIINVMSRAITVFLTFLCIKNKNQINLYCFLYSFNFVLSSGIGLVIVHKKFGIRFHIQNLNSVLTELKDGWYLFTSSALTKIVSGVGITVLGFVATNEEVGIYAAIQKIPLILVIFFSPISQALFPYISVEYSKSLGNGIRKVKNIIKIIVLIFAFAGIIIIAFQKPVIYLLYGSEYVKYSMVIVPLVCWMILSIINNFFGVQILVATGYQKEYSKSFQICVMVTLLLYIGLGNYWGIWGVALASVFSELFLTIELLYYIKKLIKPRI